MNRYLVSGFAVALVVLGAGQVGRLMGRIQELEQSPSREQETIVRLTHQLHQVRAELEATRSEFEEDDTGVLLERRLGKLESLVVEADSELELQNARLATWEKVWRGRAPDEFEQRLLDLRSALDERWRELDELAGSAARLAEMDREKLERIEGEIEPLKRTRNHDVMWRELVGPIVQLAGDSTVGSGVLLQSLPDEDGEGYTTYLLTAWHVVRDIYGSPDRTSMPVPVKVYLPDGGTAQEYARMVVYDVPLDAALLKLDTDRPMQCGARLAARERLSEIKIFDRVYAVGCPLGNDPIPTSGEVAATSHEVDGTSYWMISAPTYIGNSGGGIYDAESHELIGIFSKIYTHGSMRSTIVPHMGLVTPMTRIYEWLERSGQSQVASALHPAEAGDEVQMAALHR